MSAFSFNGEPQAQANAGDDACGLPLNDNNGGLSGSSVERFNELKLATHFRMKSMQLAVVYAIPLTAGISLVYCASRFELPEKIVRTAVLMFAKTIAALAVLYLVLLYLSR